MNRATAPPLHDDAGWLPIVLVVLAVVFNAGLAIVNAHVMRLSSASVIATELLIVAAAYLTIVRHFRPQMLPWFAMIAVTVLFAIIRGSIVGQFEPKFMRDVLLIPTFLLLGLTMSRERLPALLVVLHVFVIGGVLLEALYTQGYSSLFEVRAYYIATRAFDDTAFWNTSSDLFVSATRPGERFFSFVDWHRMSSIFLEPVSLGNYVVIVTAYLCAEFRHISRKVFVFLVAGNLLALVACDGRHAAVCSMLLILVSVVAPKLPRVTALGYLPASVLAAVVLAGATNANAFDDNFMGRLAWCVKVLGKYDVADWLGMSNTWLVEAYDSGIAYMIATQSFISVILFWGLVVMGARTGRPEQSRYLHALCLYIVLTMLVSYSLFSIKTAALLWVVHGALQRLPEPAVAAAPRWFRVVQRRATFGRSLRAA